MTVADTQTPCVARAGAAVVGSVASSCRNTPPHRILGKGCRVYLRHPLPARARPRQRRPPQLRRARSHPAVEITAPGRLAAPRAPQFGCPSTSCTEGIHP